MKRFLLIVSLIAFAGLKSFSQDAEDDGAKANRLQERMQEYVQKRLNLSKNEAEKFSPVFLRYVVELRRTNREFINDGPMRQMKVAELRVRFRGEFRTVMDEQRANRIFDYEREFKEKVRAELMNRREENKINRRNRALIHP